MKKEPNPQICNRINEINWYSRLYRIPGKDTVAQQFVKGGCVPDSFATLKRANVSADRQMLEGETLESRESGETPFEQENRDSHLHQISITTYGNRCYA